jgi:DNA-binding response OmpR family regulator
MPRLLLIDDHEPILFGMHAFFSGRGFQVDGASELEEGLALQAVRPYDVIITDLRLTDVGQAEGIEVLAEVRERYPTTRVILLTAFGSPAVVARARELRADHVLFKPLPLHELEQHVRGLLSEVVP